MKPEYLKYALLMYLLFLNLCGFCSMGIDKSKARKGRWRIPEKTLFLFALLGGSLGSFLGMHCFHHKTRHWYFRLGLPILLLFHLVLGLFFVKLLTNPFFPV